MPLSAISLVTNEGQPQELSSFVRSGVTYVLWHFTFGDTGLRRLAWKPHTSGNFTEVIPPITSAFRGLTCLYEPGADELVVIWDDGLANPGTSDGSLYMAKFNPTTGAIISGPTYLFPGSRPKLSYQRTIPGNDFLLYYRTAKNDGVYGRMSFDGGVTWQPGYPLITGRVSGVLDVEVVPFNGTHVSVAQVGDDARSLPELSTFQRTRPLLSIVPHPSDSTKFFVGGPSKFDNTTLTDNLRGGLVLATDNSKLFHLDGVNQGSEDSIGGAVALFTISGNSVSHTSSVNPVGASGNHLQGYTLAPVSTPPTAALLAGTYAVSLDVSPGYAYIAGYADNSATSGRLTVFRLSDSTTANVLTGITGVRAVGVSKHLGTPLIFVGSTESGVERLRVYQENDLSPTLLLNIKLPARANFITIASSPYNVNGALVYVSMTDRFHIYRYDGAGSPVQLIENVTSPGGGSFFQSVTSPTGNVVVAAGNGGVLVLNPTGTVLAQSTPYGKNVADWVPGKTYALNDLVKPRSTHPFSRDRYYFRCSVAGVAGNSEPLWASSGTVTNGACSWVAVGLMDPVVTGVAAIGGKIYAVGVVGGNLGTDGRIWVFKSWGLV